MTDVESVVSALRQKSKGRLQYSSDWSPVDMKIVRPSTINVSPFQIRNSSNIILDNEPGNRDRSYENYYSPERIQSVTEEKLIIRKPKPPTEKMTEFIYDIHSKGALARVDNEYQDILKSMSNMRLQNMNKQLLQFDADYANSLEEIERKNLIKLTNEKHQLQSDESLLQNEASKEINSFQQIIDQRDNISNTRIQQIETYKADLQSKLQKIQDEKQLRLKQSKALGALADSAKKVVLDMSTDYQQCRDMGCAVPQNYTVLLQDASNGYLECVRYINEGLNGTNLDLDYYIEQSDKKINMLDNLKQQGNEFALKLQKQVNDQKALADQQKQVEEEKRKKEAEDEKAKVDAKQTAVTTTTSVIVTPTQKSTATVKTPVPLDSNISISSAVPALAPLESTLKAVLESFTPKSAFLTYLKLMKQQSDLEKHIEPFNKSTVKEKKTYKFDLYKVVNTCINAISDESPKHLLDKVMKLNTLLSNNEVQVGSKSVSTKNDPLALPLCKDLLAKKLVLQGSEQVSSSFKAAFPIAAVCVGIWSLFPDCGELLLAHFYKRCPYLVPFYIPKTKDITAEQYHSLLGYDVEGKTIEEEEKYLKRLSGLVRLYAAIVSTEMPPQFGNRQHPYGINYGWIWFTQLLNLEPQPVVTATIIFDFLEVVGHVMMKKYGKQFQKLLFFVYKSYLPKIVEVTPKNATSSVIRLQLFLEGCIKAGTIKRPDGYLTTQWWKSH